MNRKQPSLVLCILMDLIGCASYAVPGLGEFSDIIWAPVSGIVFFMMFGGWKGALGGLFDFTEEILPFTDFIPTFTIAWCWKYYTSQNRNKNNMQAADTNTIRRYPITNR